MFTRWQFGGTVADMTDLTHGRFRLEDTDGKPFRFEGRMLAHSSSELPRKSRWMEVQIFQTIGGKYVVNLIGNTRLEGERIKERAHIVDTADDVIDILHQTDPESGARYLTQVARDGIEQAGEHSESIRRAWESLARHVA